MILNILNSYLLSSLCFNLVAGLQQWPYAALKAALNKRDAFLFHHPQKPQLSPASQRYRRHWLTDQQSKHTLQACHLPSAIKLVALLKPLTLQWAIRDQDWIFCTSDPWAAGWHISIPVLSFPFPQEQQLHPTSPSLTPHSDWQLHWCFIMAAHKPYFKPHFTIFLGEAGVAVGGWRGLWKRRAGREGKAPQMKILNQYALPLQLRPRRGLHLIYSPKPGNQAIKRNQNIRFPALNGPTVWCGQPRIRLNPFEVAG